MRLYVQDRRTEKIANFLWLTDKRREHTHSLLRSQAVRPRGSSSKFGDQLVSSLGGGPWTVINGTENHICRTISLSLPYATAYARIPLPRGQADMPLEIPLHFRGRHKSCSACAMTARVETRLRAGLICQAHACKAREEQRSEGLDRVPCGSHIVEEWWGCAVLSTLEARWLSL